MNLFIARSALRDEKGGITREQGIAPSQRRTQGTAVDTCGGVAGARWRGEGKKSGKRRIQKNQPELVCLVLLSMVRKERLELSRLGRQNLNLVRLPISPLPQE